MKGIIVRVRLRQFMSFPYFEIRPGRNVNLLLGPNGCGKSSLISGIILGLGGKPQDIGRANHVGEFVRIGFSESFIEIELLNPGGRNYVIERHITKEGNKSTWFINSSRVSQKQIEELMSSLHIQLNNLCQVLPQDKVYEFSRMNPQTLLENTEKSVGPEILLKYHKELKEMSKTRLELENKLKDLTVRVENETSINHGLQTTVDLMAKKASFMERIELYKQQHAWVLYRNQYSLVQELKNSLKTMKGNIAQHKKKEQQINANLLTLKKSVSNLISEKQSKKEVRQNVEAKLLAALAQADKLKEKMESIEEKYEEIMSSEQMRLKELEQLRHHLSKLECDLANYNSISEEQSKEKVKEMTMNIARINQKLSETKHEEEILMGTIQNINLQIRAEEEKWKRLEDRANQRLRIVMRWVPDVYKAIMWLRRNLDKFTHKIHEPILLEIDVKDVSYLKYLEQAIPKRDIQAFVCENKDDMTNFIKLIREEEKLAVNVVYSGAEHPPSSSYVPAVSMDRLRNLGFSLFVKDMFTAPETIMKYLCRTAGVYRIPVGSALIDKNYENIPQSVNFFFSGSNKYFVKISKYSGEKCISINTIYGPSLLTEGFDSSDADRVHKSIENLSEKKNGLSSQLSVLQENGKNYETQLRVCREERRQLQASIGGKELTERRIKDKRVQIANAEAESVNIEEERKKADTEKNAAIASLCGIDEKIKALVDQLDSKIRDCAEVNWKYHEAKERHRKEENDARSTLQAFAELDEKIKKLEMEYIKSRNEAKQCHAAALKFSDGKTPDESFYNLITDSVEGLLRKIQELKARADFMSDANNNVLQEFEERKSLINKLSEEIKVIHNKLDSINKMILETREKWLPELKTFVEKINFNFGKFFSNLGCAGEVSLASDDPENYDQYGIHIKVKFRDGDNLQDLNQYTQSGGERSVATALYMIAMQELTNVPFRCVDEINQGMDPTNERRVFELLVHATQEDHTPQYFLLTPKLLSGLTYGYTMSVTSIMASGLKETDTWDHKSHTSMFRRLKK